METDEFPKVKLLRLSGDQAARYWPVLSPGFAASMPPGVLPQSTVLNNMLQAVLSRHMNCWTVKARRGDKEPMIAGFLTAIRTDPISGQRALMIYSLFTKGDATNEEWKEAITLLRRVARAQKCHIIMAFSKNVRVIRMIENNGGNTEYRVVELEA